MSESSGYRGRIGIVLLAAGLLSTLAVPASLTDLVRMFGENRRLLRDYTWTSRTEVAIDGELRMVERFQMRIDERGSQQSTPLAVERGEGPNPRKRQSKKREKQQAKLRDALLSLIESYIHPSPQTTKQLFAEAFVWRGEDRTEGVTRVQARHVVRQGDQVSLWLDSDTEEPRRLEILTSSGGEPVRVVTEFARFEQGPFYPARVVVETEIKEKKFVMTTENDDFRRLAAETGG